VLGLLLAQATSDNAPEGAYFTLWFPLGLFIIVIAILWLRSARPHRRIPPHRPAPARGTPSQTETAAAGREPQARRAEPGYTAVSRTGGAEHGPDESGELGGRGSPGEDKETGE
jgi:hypothetical protein